MIVKICPNCSKQFHAVRNSIVGCSIRCGLAVREARWRAAEYKLRHLTDQERTALSEMVAAGLTRPHALKKLAQYRYDRKPEKQAQRRLKRPDYDRKKRYGIEAGEYRRMLAAQHGLCAICRRPETYTINGRTRPLSVDHDHQTDQIRALLCYRCNKEVAWKECFDASPYRLPILAYLKRYKRKPQPRELAQGRFFL